MNSPRTRYGGLVADFNTPGQADTSPRRTHVRQKWRTPTFFRGLLVHGSAAYLWRIRGGSAADFWVRGRVRSDPQRIHFSPREKCTRRIRHRSATGPPRSEAGPRRYRGGPESAHLIAKFLLLVSQHIAQLTILNWMLSLEIWPTL